MERMEQLWPNGPQYWYDEQCFPPSTDSFLLGSFPSLRRGERVCDLGAGAGLLSLLLLAREPTLQLTGIELDGHACHMMARNAAVNGLPLSVMQADLRNQSGLPSGQFRLVVSNPPYFAPHTGAVAQGLEAKRLRFVQHTAGSAPSLLLLECRRGGKPGLTMAPPVLLRLPDGSEAPDSRRAYCRDKE